jgi:hypothetical protein
VTDRRPSLLDAIRAFGFTAEVYLPGELTPVSSGAFWLSTQTSEQPVGEVFARAEGIRRLVIPVAAVGAVPRGTVVVCPEFEGEPAASWRVEQSTRVDFDHHRCTVIPNPS